MNTIRLTMAQAFVRYLTAQRSIVRGQEVPLIPAAFAIFGHGNVSCLGEALEAARAQLPTWRGQNEQSMALAAIGYAKAQRRRQALLVTSSIGPGALNMVTAAAVAMANRLPVLLAPGDNFASRLPDPVLQQLEHFGDPTITATDAFRPVCRYWDRITRPEQIIHSLPQAIGTLLDPADCGPVCLALAQDVQGHAYDYPEAFFEPRTHRPFRPRADAQAVQEAAALLRQASHPMLIAGGGVHYSEATQALSEFAQRHRLPVAETMAGRSALQHQHPCNIGPLGVLGATGTNALAAQSDLIFAVGTRLQDFTTASWSLFSHPQLRFVSLNAARYDATKHRACAVIGDARCGLEELSAALAGWQAPQEWLERAQRGAQAWNAELEQPPTGDPLSYAQVIQTVNRMCTPTDLVVCAAGGLPGELYKNWKALGVGSLDFEYGFSCMGYEIAGAYGAKMAQPEREVIAFVGDGSYLMLNSELYSSIRTGHKLIVVLCDNAGFASIHNLQTSTGSPGFNNLLRDCAGNSDARVDFVQHAQSLGAHTEVAQGIADLESAFARAREADRSCVIYVRTDPLLWTGGGAWWEVGMPEVSTRPEMKQLRARFEEAKQRQSV